MPLLTFCLLTSLGAGIWVVILALLGYWFGANAELLGEHLKRLSLWLALLQKKCLEVRKAEVAALESDDSDEISKFNARGVELRAERDELIKRVEAVIDDLEKKAGDVTEARAYVKSVIIAPLKSTSVRSAPRKSLAQRLALTSRAPLRLAVTSFAIFLI